MTEKKDILLILPPLKPMFRSIDLVYVYFEKISSGNQLKFLPIPNGIMSIGALLEHEGYAVGYYDFCHFESNQNLKDLIETLIEKYDPKIVGGYSYTSHLNGLRKVFHTFKQISPEIKTIAGGPHVTFLDLQTINEFNGDLDVVVRGEGELTTLELVSNVVKGKPYDTIRGTTNARKQNPMRKLLSEEELMNLPPINLDLIPKNELNKPLYFSIHCSRGCPNRCSFCAESHFWCYKLRVRSVNTVINEITMINDKYNVFFDFGDSNLPIIKSFDDLTNQISKINLKNSLGMVLIRANLVNDARIDSLKKMLNDHPKAYITIGVENASDKILKLMRKPSWDIQYSALKKIKENDFNSIPSWMIGFPGEDLETMTYNLKCLNFLNENNLIQTTIFSIFIPTPGTEPFFNPEKYGIKIHTLNWDFYDRAVFPPPYSLIDKNGRIILSSEQIWAYYISMLTLQKNWRLKKAPNIYKEIDPEIFLNNLQENPIFYNVSPTESDITTYEDYGGLINN